MRLGRRGLLGLTISLTMAGGWLAAGGSGTAFALVGHSYYVARTGSDATTCQANSNLHPFMTITRAMECVASDAPPPFAPDLVHIAAGTYKEIVLITGNVHLLGAGRGVTIIDGSGSGPVIGNLSYTVEIEAVTITDGFNSNYGGGIANDGNMTVDNSLVTNNSAGCGGGIGNDGTMKLVNTPVTDNNTVYADSAGGGILNAYPGTMTLNNSPVIGNVSGSGGGGIANGSNEGCLYPGGTMHLVNSRVSDNSADGDGGGIMNYDNATLTLLNSPVGGSQSPNGGDEFSSPNTGNGANGDGGGIWNDDSSSASLLNSPVSFNGTDCGNGAGLWNGGDSVMSVMNSAVNNNAVTGFCFQVDGGGVYNESSSNSRLTLKNENIFQNHASGDGGGLYDEASEGSDPEGPSPADPCTGFLDVTMSNTVITQNTVDNC